MEIRQSARKHGITDADMLHAVRNVLGGFYRGDDVTILVGTAQNGSFLEIGVADFNSTDERIIHAMPLRAGFYRYLTGGVI